MLKLAKVIPWLLLFSCSKPLAPTQIECIDDRAKLESLHIILSQKTLEIKKCEEEKESMQSQIENMDEHMKSLNEEAEDWRGKYLNIPSCGEEND